MNFSNEGSEGSEGSEGNEVHPLCVDCKFDEGQNFMIIGNIVYKLCHKHSEEYTEIYCNTCELYHFEPNVEEICAVAQRRFLDLDVSEDGSVNQDMGMDDMD